MPNQQSLSLTHEQRQIQILAPQLLQSLKLLQLPVLELRTLIQNELQQNPTLEENAPETTPVDIEPGGSEVDDSKELDFNKEFEILSRVDDEWYNYFMPQREYQPYDSSREKKRNFFLDSRIQQESLQDHLTQQLTFSGLSKQNCRIGELIIGSINDDGYLVQNVEELAESTGIDFSHIKDILSVVQDFDPIGVGARDLKECLLLQMERLGQSSRISGIATAVIRDHLDILGTKHFKEIAHALNISVEEVHLAAKLISTLEPKPGRAFSSETPTYIFPDVLVEKIDGSYVVMLNDDQVPHLHISKHYKQLMNEQNTKEDVKNYIKDRIRAGLFLIKSIAQRKQTMYNVASQVVRVQSDFLDLGINHLKPLTMAEVAEIVGIHETTVCRCIANKYMKTPRGLFEMKYFFTPGLKTTDGKAISNKTVQDRIASIISSEDPDNPLSDQDILETLKKEGVHIARRTVAKYRLTLKILPSHLRKTH